jgi:hypothetical protein
MLPGGRGPRTLGIQPFRPRAVAAARGPFLQDYPGETPVTFPCQPARGWSHRTPDGRYICYTLPPVNSRGIIKAAIVHGM